MGCSGDGGRRRLDGVESNRAVEKGVEENDGSGSGIVSAEGENRGDAIPTARLYLRIKNRSASPIRILSPAAAWSPLIRAGCCAVSGTLTQCTTDTETRTRRP